MRYELNRKIDDTIALKSALESAGAKDVKVMDGKVIFEGDKKLRKIVEKFTKIPKTFEQRLTELEEKVRVLEKK